VGARLFARPGHHSAPQATAGPACRISLIGEAKATVQPRGPHDVERLEHIRARLGDLGHHAGDAVLALYSLHGFHPDVQRAAARRTDLLLIDLAALYGDGSAQGLA